MDRNSDISRAQQHSNGAGLVGERTVNFFRSIARALGRYSRELYPSVIDTNNWVWLLEMVLRGLEEGEGCIRPFLV